MSQRTTRRRLFHHAAVGLASSSGLLGPLTTFAQSGAGFSNGTIQLIVPLGAGGVADTGARVVARRLGTRGFGGCRQSARWLSSRWHWLGVTCKPRRPTLLRTTGGFAAAPVLMKAFEFDPIRDFQTITMAVTGRNEHEHGRIHRGHSQGVRVVENSCRSFKYTTAVR